MSTTPPTVNQNDPETGRRLQLKEIKEVDLNAVLKNSLQNFQLPLRRSNVIIRCESLPVIDGDPESIDKLFHHLFTMILSIPPSGSKLFLRIECSEQEEEMLTFEGMQKRKMYQIKFHTNITTTENWKEQNGQLLAESKIILAQQNARFAVNNIDNNGCLFTINFPGKLDETCL